MKKNNRKEKVKKVNSKSQTWSIDVLLAATLFVAGIVIFFYVLSYSGDSDTVKELESESESIPEKVIAVDEKSATTTSFVIGNKVDEDKLNSITNKTYEQVKSEIGIFSDFCIHFEDENGNLINIGNDSANPRYSIGDPKLNFTIIDENGQQIVIPCGT
ncbi:MAG: hypothetical protein MAG795_00559 [Candidatus Woesearchaeota archaeon]|nr:hypothetical protein [Candidatus Woesearchaeota archaeon]